jgi:hypothetical protein
VRSHHYRDRPITPENKIGKIATGVNFLPNWHTLKTKHCF